MNKNFTKLIVLLFAFVIGSGNMWADVVTFDASKDVTNATHTSYTNVLTTFNCDDGSTWKAIGFQETQYTWIGPGQGGANYLETPEVNGTITSVAVTWSGNTSYYLALQTTDGTELDAKQNPSSSSTEIFNVSGSYSKLRLVGRRSSGTSNALAKIEKVVVTYTSGGGGSQAVATTTTIDASGITNTDANISTSAGSLSATVSANNTPIEGATVTWSGNNDAVATIDSDGVVTLVGAGTVTFTAAYAGVSGTYQPSSGTYQMTVTYQPTTIEITPNYTFWGKNSSFSGTTYPYLEGTKDNVSLEWESGNQGNTYANQNAMRFYPKNTLTFTAPTGYEIKSITLTISGTYSDLTFDPTGFSGTTWTGASNSVEMSRPSTGSSYATISKFTIIIGLPSSVATPTFNPEAGTYNEAQSVTISCETQGATIYYTTDGTAPTNASTQYSSAIIVAETTTIKAIAYDGTDYSDVATANYIIDLPLSTMDQIYAKASENNGAAKSAVIVFNDWIVTGVGSNAKRAFVSDGTKGFIIYNSNGGLTFEKGQVLSGQKDCQVQLLNGAPCVTGLNASDFAITQTGQEPIVTTTTIDALIAINTGAVVNLGVLTWTGSAFRDSNNNEITYYNTIYSQSFTTDKTYNVKGVFVYYSENSNPKEIAPRDANDIVEVQLPSFELEIEASNGTVDVYIGGEQQTGTDGSYQIPQGSIVTLTATPSDGYHFVEWQVEAEEGTVSIINNQFTMPACYVLVQAVFEEIPTVVYYYSINGVDDEEYTEVPEGTIIQLASSQDINSDFTFAGWTTDPNDVSDILPAGSNFTMDNTYVFYAVYAHTTGVASNAKDGEAGYVKVTNTDEITDGNYLIVYEMGAFGVAFDGSLPTLDAANNTIDVNVENGTIPSDNTTDAAVFTIAALDGGYSIQSASGYYIGSDSHSNELDVNLETPYVNTISIDNDGNAVIIGYYTSNTNYTALRYNSASNQKRFRYYKEASQQAIQLYKYNGGSTPTPTPTTAYYTRVFYNETVEDDIEIIGPSIIPSGQILDMGEDGAIYNSIEATFIIEDGAELFSNYEVEAATLQKMVLSYDNDEGEGGWKVIASPLTSTVTATAVNNLIDATPANYGLFYYDEPNHMWYNYKQNQGGTNLHPGFSIEPGKGYLYAKNSDVMIEFVGEMSAAEDPYEISDLSHASTGANSNGFNLVGNPFTYTVYANQPFYIPSDDILATVDQYWTVGIAPGSGIMVQATEDNDYSVIFTRTAPAEPTKGSVQMTLSQSTTNRGGVTKLDKAIVSFNEGSKLGKFYFGESVANIYIPQGNEEYAIVSAEAQGELPVNFRASENGTYTLSMDVENMDMNYLHLIDNMTGMDIDLLQTPSYTFEAKVNDYESRFRLVYAANNEDSASAGSTAFAFFSNGSWIINNAGEATLQVVDLTGRILSSETVNGSVSTIINAVPGVYMLRLINGENVNVQKIVVR